MARSRQSYTASAGLLGVLALGALLSLGSCTKMGPTIPEDDETTDPNDPGKTGFRSWGGGVRFAVPDGPAPPLILV